MLFDANIKSGFSTPTGDRSRNVHHQFIHYGRTTVQRHMPRLVLHLLWLAAAHGLRRCAPLRLCDTTLSDHSAEVTRLHQRIADGGTAGATREAHNRRQASTFREAADFFASAEATPASVIPALRGISSAVAAVKPDRVLDVGTGTGALLPMYLESGIALSSVTGVDLSDSMLAYARARYPEATFVCSDFVDFSLPPEGAYDAIVFNACFGNLFDQRAALAHASALLRTGGAVFISHPLGSEFVRELHVSDPTVVPHKLPSQDALAKMVDSGPAAGSIPLSITSFHDSPDGSSLDAPVPYLAMLTRTP